MVNMMDAIGAMVDDFLTKITGSSSRQKLLKLPYITCVIFPTVTKKAIITATIEAQKIISYNSRGRQ